MSALTILRAASRDVANERYVEVMEAIDALAELVEKAKRANGDHTAPHDCYATGPLTGDPYTDLVACPGCQLTSALTRCGVPA